MSKRVAVLMGGWSSERDVSLVSGTAVVEALNAAGHDAYGIDVGEDIGALVAALTPAPDVAFNALHGRYGEDGTVQGMLELMRIPYTHSGVLASSIAMDKPMAKHVFESVGIRCAEHLVMHRDEIAAGIPMDPPYVIKPINEGSSVGVRIVFDDEAEKPLLNGDWPFGERVMIERYIHGRELTVAVMGDTPLGVTEIRPLNGFYDYTAKYTEGRAEHVVPADIPDDVRDEALRISVLAHDALGCRGVSRADLRYDDTDGAGPEKLYMLEVNTQPGMTPLSLVPEQAAYAGTDFGDLVLWMVEQATCDS